MAGKGLILDFTDYDLNQVVADLEEIRRWNPQRFEMEQLTAIVYEDRKRHVCVGYKDIALDEFWVRGHMPGRPVLPGVLMCEAAAQTCGYYAQRYDVLGAEMIGLGGLDEVRFRALVFPGDRLVVVCELLKARRGAMVTCRFQEFVEQTLVCEGTFKGVPLPVSRMTEGTGVSR